MAPRTPDDKETTPAKAKPAKAKPAPRAKPAAKAKTKSSADAAERPALRVVEEADAAEAAAGALRLKDLIYQVSQATNGKKADVKPVIEATLTVLGSALATGKSLTIPPLGKVRVVKNKGPALTLKLRLADGPKAAGLALADDGEDD
jgi:hypothetical protein